jgi:hypothetical protein
MTRLASTVKAHFFPTPLALIPAIAALIEAPLEGGTIFDPCAGTGETVAALGALLGLRAGGNELDATRAEEARTRLAFCTTGPYDALTVKQSGAQVVFLNPPYADDKSRARLEVQSLAPALRCLAPGGVLIAVVPRQVALSAPFLQTLGAVCDLRGVRRFPDGDVEAYDQVVIWGQRRHKRAELATEAQLRSVLHDEFRRAGVPGSTYGQTSTLPVLRLVPATPCTVYPTRLPLIVENTLGDPAAFLALSGGKLALRAPAFRTLTIGARVGGTSVVPILPIRPAHSAALLAAGLVDGAEVTHRGAAVLVRGSTVKTVITREEDLSDTQIKLVHREKFAGRLTLLDLATGVLTVLDESNPTHRDAYEAFVTEQFDTLSTLLVERYPARFVPGVSVDAPIVARVLDALYFAKPLPRQVTPGLLPKQREVVSGIVHTLRTARHAVVAEAEMSSGKGSMGTAIAAATDAERLLAGTWRTVIVGPAHLAKKWQRELTSILAAFDVRFTIARTVGDVDAAFAHEGNAAVFLTREAGKMGMKWRQAFAERNVHTIVEERVHGVQKRVRYSQRVAACPDCGASTINGSVKIAAPRCGSACRTRVGVRVPCRGRAMPRASRRRPSVVEKLRSLTISRRTTRGSISLLMTRFMNPPRWNPTRALLLPGSRRARGRRWASPGRFTAVARVPSSRSPIGCSPKCVRTSRILIVSRSRPRTERWNTPKSSSAQRSRRRMATPDAAPRARRKCRARARA